MPRSHRASGQVVIQKDDDLWVFFVAAERRLHKFVETRPGDELGVSVRVVDEHGSSTEASVAAAQADSNSQRTKPTKIHLFARVSHPIQEGRYASPTISVHVGANFLTLLQLEHSTYVSGLEPHVDISVSSEVSEEEARGLAEVLRLDLQHAIDRERAGMRVAPALQGDSKPQEPGQPTPDPTPPKRTPEAQGPQPDPGPRPAWVSRYLPGVAEKVIAGLILAGVISLLGWVAKLVL